jgi:hypothetical protein
LFFEDPKIPPCGAKSFAAPRVSHLEAEAHYCCFTYEIDLLLMIPKFLDPCAVAELAEARKEGVPARGSAL